MKRFRVLAASLPFLILSTATGNAQTRIVLTGGVNFARIEGDIHSFRQPRPANGFSAGLAAIMPTRGSLEFELRGAYSWMAKENLFHYQQVSIREWTTRVSGLIFGNHVELMALGRMNVPWAAKRLRTFVAAGPALSWRVSCHVRSTLYDSLSWNADSETTACRSMHRLDFGLAGALGLEYRLAGDVGATFGAEYTQSLRNLTEVLYQGSDESARRQALTVRAGLVYRIGRREYCARHRP